MIRPPNDSSAGIAIATVAVFLSVFGLAFSVATARDVFAVIGNVMATVMMFGVLVADQRR